MARDAAPHSRGAARVIWHVSTRPAADYDLQEARDWYEAQRPGLGDEFLLAVAEAFTRLEESPLSVPVYYGGFRRMLTATFPYKIFFRTKGEAVIVFRVLHAAREHTRQLK